MNTETPTIEQEETQVTLADLPSDVTDPEMLQEHGKALTAALNKCFKRYTGGSAFALRWVFGFIMDSVLEYHENDRRRWGVARLQQAWRGRIVAKQKSHIARMLKKSGGIPNVEFVMPDGRTRGEHLIESLWKACKSFVANNLNAFDVDLIKHGRKDDDGNEIEPVTVDLTDVTWTDEVNQRADNLYASYSPNESYCVVDADDADTGLDTGW